MISIIIPAHNEARVIRRTLETITTGANPGEIEVIVVCNGCTDETAAVARSFGEPVEVIDTPAPGKARALNLGDQAARGSPRIYVDADISLPIAVIRKLAHCLTQGTFLAAAPRPFFDVSSCGWCARAYYDINSRLPSSREGLGGSGVYALSEQGRSSFNIFPDITADDLFVRLQFPPEKRTTLQDCTSTVYAPRSLSDLIAIKTRSHFGAYELRQRFPDLWVNRGRNNGREVLKLWKNPLLWPRLTLYCYVKLTVRILAKRRLRRGITKLWERDETSRDIKPAPVGMPKGII